MTNTVARADQHAHAVRRVGPAGLLRPVRHGRVRVRVRGVVAALMEKHAEDSADLRDATQELRKAVGLEDREKSS